MFIELFNFSFFRVTCWGLGLEARLKTALLENEKLKREWFTEAATG